MEKATDLARAMITQYGMSEKFGLMCLEKEQDTYLSGRTVLNCSDSTYTEVDAEVKELLKTCYERAKALLAENREAMDRIAQYLFEKENITGKQFMAIFENRDPDAKPEDTDTNEDIETNEETATEEVTIEEKTL
jgi:cell division protease FtsH